MAEPLDIDTVKKIINTMLSQRAGPVTAREIRWIIEALDFFTTNYTWAELDHIVHRTVPESTDRPLAYRRLDS